MRERPVLLSLIVTAGFMLARHVVHVCAGEGASFLSVDLLKTGPRLAAVAVCWWGMRPRGAAAWGWTGRTRTGALLALAAFVAHCVSYAGQKREFAPAQILLGALLTVPVAVWEELCYRGLLYVGLRERFGALPAALLSSAAFTGMHWGAMPFATWPSIFLTGFAFCGAAELGAGLPVLIVSHWAIDTVWFFASGEGAGPFWGIISHVAMTTVCFFAWNALRETPDGGPSATRPG